jgi:phosphoribosylamine-glycine ligase
VVLPRFGEDILPWLLDAASGQLPLRSPDWLPGICVCVVLAAEGYPGKIRSGRRYHRDWAAMGSWWVTARKPWCSTLAHARTAPIW